MKLLTVILTVVMTVLVGQSGSSKKTHIYWENIPCMGVLRVSGSQITALEMRKKSDNNIVDTLLISERTIRRVGVRDVPDDEQFVAVLFIEIKKINNPQGEAGDYKVYAIRPKVLEELKKYFGEAKPTKDPA